MLTSHELAGIEQVRTFYDTATFGKRLKDSQAPKLDPIFHQYKYHYILYGAPTSNQPRGIVLGIVKLDDLASERDVELFGLRQPSYFAYDNLQEYLTKKLWSDASRNRLAQLMSLPMRTKRTNGSTDGHKTVIVGMGTTGRQDLSRARRTVAAELIDEVLAIVANSQFKDVIVVPPQPAIKRKGMDCEGMIQQQRENREQKRQHRGNAANDLLAFEQELEEKLNESIMTRVANSAKEAVKKAARPWKQQAESLEDFEQKISGEPASTRKKLLAKKKRELATQGA